MRLIIMHDHHHCHHDHHTPKNHNLPFFFGITLNFLFVCIEFVYGHMSGSLALIADAGHNLSDVAGLILAWAALWFSQKKPSRKFTFGLRKSSILAALFNSLFLLVAVGIIMWEAIHRFKNPGPIQSQTVMIVAGIGLIINALTALFFFKDKDHDLNIKGAFLHMLADALISLGVLISGLIISLTAWNWLDPLMSLLISLIIIYGTWDLLKHSFSMSLDAVPEGIDPNQVKRYLESLENVSDVHDLHIWAMSTTETALTVHLTLKSNTLDNHWLQEISKHLKSHFKIHHPTIQLELFDLNYDCHFKPEDIV